MVLIVLILMISIVHAIPETSNPRPTIEVNFDEEIDPDTIEAQIQSLGGLVYEVERTYDSPNHLVFNFRPTDALIPGTYNFEVVALDIYGNPGGEQLKQFKVILPAFDIEIIEPTFGVSSEFPFNITIYSTRMGECKYSFINISYENMVLDLETSEDEVYHTKENYNELIPTDFHVRCEDYYGNIGYNNFYLVHDTTSPSISVNVEDLYQYNRGILSTKMHVTSNEDIVCKFSINDYLKEFDDMEWFDNTDETIEEDYMSTFEQVLNHSLINYEQNNVYVICKDKAGRLSSKTTDAFMVNTNQTPTVTIVSPTPPHEYTSNTSIYFDIRTNKDAICKYDTDSSKQYNEYSFTLSGTQKEHTALKSFLPGTYTYHFMCSFNVEGVKPYVSTTFTIDTTEPELEYVNDSNPDLPNDMEYSYSDDRLYGAWRAYDNESGIDSYSYFIYRKRSIYEDELIESGETSSESKWVSSLELNDSEEYYFVVYATNGVGLVSDNESSNGIVIDLSLKPETCSDNIKNGNETDTDCGGNSCGRCSSGKTCYIDNDCVSGYCNSSGECQDSSCNDGIKNGDEAGIDCGGSCSTKCTGGTSCNLDSDCQTGKCNSDTGLCYTINELCVNNVKDVFETDLDCGGLCAENGIKCANDMICLRNSDCISENCENGICVYVPQDSDNDGIEDQDDNCVNMPNAGQEDTDNDGEGDACDDDIDGDGLKNTFEERYGYDPYNADTDSDGIDDSEEDDDNDGLVNLEEQLYNTNPKASDSDGDGYSDKEEIDAGTDPNDSSDKPGSIILLVIILIVSVAILGVGGYYGYILYEQKKYLRPSHEVRKGMVQKGRAIKQLPEIYNNPYIPEFAKKPLNTVTNVIKDALGGNKNVPSNFQTPSLGSVSRKTPQQLRQEEMLKKELAKYTNLSDVSYDAMNSLKGKSRTQIQRMFENKDEEAVQKILKDITSKETKTIDKGEFVSKKDDVFEALGNINKDEEKGRIFGKSSSEAKDLFEKLAQYSEKEDLTKHEKSKAFEILNKLSDADLNKKDSKTFDKLKDLIGKDKK